eukprot:CAMPEP_0202827992 /NCGR_PEP_ID=MMETSP1389-20130828/14652_1 /ASSEMBLY_ACC=CAM_ASM_000865 /TAXON_ID=302021 /ORGANISM="Rhodomonas sp., Strain CCMP768" /LENGTH=37 /DNA_ID= /DNA_START= /DNA_END= /DNA_ORIENTATION=
MRQKGPSRRDDERREEEEYNELGLVNIFGGNRFPAPA